MPRTTRETRQKKEIQHIIDKTEEFFTAEDIYELIKSRHKDIGLATIYRYLKKLRKDGLIYSYSCDGKRVYSRLKKSHCHFICERTGKIIHFDVDSLDFIKSKIPGTITSFQIEVKGRCDDCQSKP